MNSAELTTNPQIKYNDAKIYRLTDGILTYYGSTCGSLAARKSQHKRGYNSYIIALKKYCSAYKVFQSAADNGTDVDIILVRSVNCANIDELRKIEREYIEGNACTNINIPTRTSREVNKLRLHCIECEKTISRGYHSDHKKRARHRKNAIVSE